MGRRRKKSPGEADELANPNCEAVERRLRAALVALDWNLSRRTARKFCATKHLEGFTFRTVIMFPRPSGGADLVNWLNILAHELMHVVGYRMGSTMTGPKWSEKYSSCVSEERVAEWGSIVLCSALGLEFLDWNLMDSYEAPSFEEQVEAVRRVGHVLRLTCSSEHKAELKV